MNDTPKGNRLHIAIFGKRNAGKSSLFNALIGQEIAIVSNIPGTTTDPVEKAIEFQPLGPVVFVDTAGLDDKGELGTKRIEQSKLVFKKTDLALILIEASSNGKFEKELIENLTQKKVPIILIINKEDLLSQIEKIEIQKIYSELNNLNLVFVSTLKKTGIQDLKEAIINSLSEKQPDPPLILDIVQPEDTVVLVIPIDKEAPKGRLILPEAQTIRECLDGNISCLVVRENELTHALTQVLKHKPKIVITDSQVFETVNANTPSNILMTSFSILFARQKGDIKKYLNGIKAIKNLKNGDKILIAELCTHKPVTEDIGRIKIPNWLTKYTGLKLEFEFAVGAKPQFNPKEYALIVQCGGCVVTRTLILNRINELEDTPVTNYGILIAYLHGILPRALQPFPHLLKELNE